MKFELVKDEELSGDECSIYQVYWEEFDAYLYDVFWKKNVDLHKTQLRNIDNRLYAIGHEMGAREHFFKLHEGKPGDLVCALYDTPDSKLRLYCIRYGMDLVVIGGGGEKSKDIRAYQEDENLTRQAEIVKTISNAIYNKQKDKDIRLINLGKDFEGELKFGYDEE